MRTSADWVQVFDAYCRARQPLSQLPLSLTVDHSAMRHWWYREPVKLAFGFGTTIDDLLAYANKVKILTTEKLEACEEETLEDLMVTKALKSVERHLRWVTRARLKFRTPVHVKYDTVITLWDNFTKEAQELDDEDTKEVLDLLREELGLPEDEQPMWYFETQ